MIVSPQFKTINLEITTDTVERSEELIKTIKESLQISNENNHEKYRSIDENRFQEVLSIDENIPLVTCGTHSTERKKSKDDKNEQNTGRKMNDNTENKMNENTESKMN